MRCSHLWRNGSWSRGSQASRAVVCRFLSAMSTCSGVTGSREPRLARASGRGTGCGPAPPATTGRYRRAARPGAAMPAGLDQHQRLDARGVAHRHLQRDPAAHRAPDDEHVPQVELLAGNRDRSRRGRGCSRATRARPTVPKPGCSGTRTSKRSGELLHERHDHRRPARAVQVEERGARAAAAEVHPAAVDLDELLAEGHLPAVLRGCSLAGLAAGRSAPLPLDAGSPRPRRSRRGSAAPSRARRRSRESAASSCMSSTQILLALALRVGRALEALDDLVRDQRAEAASRASSAPSAPTGSARPRSGPAACASPSSRSRAAYRRTTADVHAELRLDEAAPASALATSRSARPAGRRVDRDIGGAEQ